MTDARIQAVELLVEKSSALRFARSVGLTIYRTQDHASLNEQLSFNMPSILITLGSNINKEQNLPKAVEALRNHPAFRFIAVSPIYETAPVGNKFPQENFYNAAAWLQTDLAPSELRQTLRAMEAAQGRVRTADKAAPRTIDLDIAFYGQEIVTVNGRHIPDPDIVRFPHLALPLADIAPDWSHPENGFTLRQIALGLTYTETEIRKL